MKNKKKKFSLVRKAPYFGIHRRQQSKIHFRSHATTFGKRINGKGGITQRHDYTVMVNGEKKCHDI